MNNIVTLTVISLLVAGPVLATQAQVRVEHGFPLREARTDSDFCYLGYYDYCSGSVFCWNVYCGDLIGSSTKLGTCFDLNDCGQGGGDSQILTDAWWAWSVGQYGYMNINVYCADEHCCPVGAPLTVIVGYVPTPQDVWQHIPFDNVNLECPSGKFIVMATLWNGGQWPFQHDPYSDANGLNIFAGCEDEWRCAGHSFIYRNAVSYCDVYGTPAPLWKSYPGTACTDVPTVPAGCHNQPYDTGFSCEFLCDLYICQRRSCLSSDLRAKMSPFPRFWVLTWSDMAQVLQFV